MVGVTEKITFPHTLVGMVPEYPAEPVSALGDRNLARGVLCGALDSVVRWTQWCAVKVTQATIARIAIRAAAITSRDQRRFSGVPS